MRFIHAWQHTQTQLLSALLTLVLSEQQPSPVADNPAGACNPAGAQQENEFNTRERATPANSKFGTA